MKGADEEQHVPYVSCISYITAVKLLFKPAQFHNTVLPSTADSRANNFKARANSPNVAGQQNPTLLANNIQTCCIQHVW